MSMNPLKALKKNFRSLSNNAAAIRLGELHYDCPTCGPNALMVALSLPAGLPSEPATLHLKCERCRARWTLDPNDVAANQHILDSIERYTKSTTDE